MLPAPQIVQFWWQCCLVNMDLGKNLKGSDRELLVTYCLERLRKTTDIILSEKKFWSTHERPKFHFWATTAILNRNVRGMTGTWDLLQIRIYIYIYIFPPGTTQPIVGVYFTALYRALASSRTRLLDHIQRRATVGRTPLNEWSVRRTDLYLTTHNTHNRQTSMPPVGFEPTIAEGERP